MRFALLALVVLVCAVLGFAPATAVADACCPCPSAVEADDADCCDPGPDQCSCAVAAHLVAVTAVPRAAAEPAPAAPATWEFRSPAALRTLPSPAPPTPPPIG